MEPVKVFCTVPARRGNFPPARFLGKKTDARFLKDDDFANFLRFPLQTEKVLV